MFNLDKRIKCAASAGIHLSRFNRTLSGLFPSSRKIYQTFGMRYEIVVEEA